MPQTNSHIYAFSQQLRTQAHTRHCRYLVALFGEYDVALRHARLIFDQAQRVYHNLTENAATNWTHVDNEQLKRLLGQEIEHFVFDGHADINPDHLGIIGGLIPAGGLLVLLLPPQTDCLNHHSHHLRFMCQILHTDHAITWSLDNSDSIPELPDYPPKIDIQEDKWPDFSQQQQAINTVERVVTGSRRKPALILAPRGRGKSTALGKAANALFESGITHIGVTSQNRTAVTQLLHQIDTQHIEKIRYYAPDTLIAEQPKLPLLLVDEAATIPLAQLTRLLEIYPRIAFATTTEGYEGTGQGLLLPFQQTLTQLSRAVRLCHLDDPIRWHPKDPLEPILKRLLVLDAELAQTLDNPISVDQLQYQCHNGTQLATNETRLRQIIALLRLSHYRTRPRDVKHLLDSDLICASFSDNGQLIAAILLAQEGPVADDLAQDIWLGSRRVRDQRLPQILINKCGYLDAKYEHFIRIIRIVVQPNYRRQGIGQKLLQYIEKQFQKTHSYIGASFAATPEVLGFWHQNNYKLLRIGEKRQASHINHHALVLKPLNDQKDTFIPKLQQQFFDALPLLLTAELNVLSDDLVYWIYRHIKPEAIPSLNDDDIETLNTFALGNRAAIDCKFVLRKALLNILQQPTLEYSPSINIALRYLLKSHTLKLSICSIETNQQGNRGKKQAEQQLRLLIKHFLKHRQNENHTQFQQ